MSEFKIRLPTSKLVSVDVRFIDLEAVSSDGFLSFILPRIHQDFLLIFRRLHVILKELCSGARDRSHISLSLRLV